MLNLSKILQFIFFSCSLIAASVNNDLKILNQTDQSVTYELNLQNFHLEETYVKNDQSYKTAAFDNAAYISSGNPYDLPSRSLRFGLPVDGDISVELISKSNLIIKNVVLKELA